MLRSWPNNFHLYVAKWSDILPDGYLWGLYSGTLPFCLRLGKLFWYQVAVDFIYWHGILNALQGSYNGRDGVWNHKPRDCFLWRLIRRRSKKTSKLRVTGHCVGNSPVTGEFPAQNASNAENASIRWRHHVSSCDLPSVIRYHYSSPIGGSQGDVSSSQTKENMASTRLIVITI